MSTERGHTYGGQAVIEGVMIRGRTNVSVAVRRPDGTIALQSRRLSPLFTGRLRQVPLVRGVIALIETLILGMRALSYSANVGIEEEGKEIGKVSMVTMTLVSLLFAIGLFFLVPVFASRGLEGALGSSYATNIAEGLIRLVIFLAYILLIGRMSDIRRVFMYHGAEHMTVHAQERGEVLSLESVRKYSTAHPRCGTAFLLVVMVVAIIVFVVVGREPLWWLIASRIVLMPFIAAVSYELIRLSGRHSGNPLVGLISGPSLALQALTTREPEDDQIEIAITAMRRTLEVDDKGIALVESEYGEAESSADETGQP
ncbi:MAG: DUF1385 domain-containing protein [Chloroflexi bacterium]|nr:DUF1385 domain-containing protein [Chloroflexota bacterium]